MRAAVQTHAQSDGCKGEHAGQKDKILFNVAVTRSFPYEKRKRGAWPGPMLAILLLSSVYQFTLRIEGVLWRHIKQLQELAHTFGSHLRHSHTSSSEKNCFFSSFQFHFLICSMRLAFLWSLLLCNTRLLTKVSPLPFFFCSVVYEAFPFSFYCFFPMSFNHNLNPPHLPHQKALYLLPWEPLLLFSKK